MMTDYQVIKETSIEELQLRVEILMEKGWEPLGGLAVYKNELRVFFCQAMGK
jgi:hypothetical protein